MDTYEAGIASLHTQSSLEPAFESQPQPPPRVPTPAAAQELNPLLSNLSTSSTLQVLQDNDAVAYNRSTSTESTLTSSISHASEKQRALGIRAALAGKRLKEWCLEAESWHWPDSKFVPPPASGTTSLKGSDGSSSESNMAYELVGYYGSLPAQKVSQLEDRIEAIKDDMEALDVEDLKNHVRQAHMSRNISTYSATNSSQSNYQELDDFTFVITATIMQALPLISRLNKLLNVWTVRLYALRQIPGFLRLLDETDITVTSAWNTIGNEKLALDLTRASFVQMKSILEARVSKLGQKLDRILDTLEGQMDRIPDRWIDDMENLQVEYENWVVRAGRQVDYNQLLAEKAEKAERAENAARSDKAEQPALSEIAGKHYYQAPKEALSRSLPDPDSESRSHATNHGNDKGAGEVEPTVLRGTYQAVPVDNTNTISKSTISDQPKRVASNDLRNVDASRGAKALSEKMADVTTGPEETQSAEPFEPNTTLNTVAENGQPAELPEVTSLPPIRSPPTAENNALQKATTLEQDLPKEGPEATHNNVISRPARLSDGKLDEAPLGKKLDMLDLHKIKTAENDPNDLGDVPDSASTSSFSDISSAEIMEAAPAQFYKTPTEEFFPLFPRVSHPSEPVSRRSSQKTITTLPHPLAEIYKHQAAPSNSSWPPRRVSSSSLDDSGSEISHGNIHGSGYKVKDRPKMEVRHASTTSLEVISRRELRNINIVRTSTSTLVSPTASPSPFSRATVLGSSAPTSLQGDERERSPSPSLRIRKQRHSAFPHLENNWKDTESRPGWPGFDPLEPLELNNEALDTMPHPPVEDPPESPKLEPLEADFLDSSKNKASTIEDKLNAKISSILHNIPANIKLASTSDIPPPNVKQRASSLQPRPKPPQRASTPGLTLAPADNRALTSRREGDSEIKLYHLHQPGKDKPMKLHVRLVGEDKERVMVRVGGGWADLEEWLSEYAFHHGRRAVSTSQVEIVGNTTSSQAAGTASQSSFLTNGRRTPISRPASPYDRSGSSLAMRKIRRASGVSNSPQTPDMPFRQWDNTPGSSESRPYSRQSEVSWNDEGNTPLGLAGPKGKDIQMSPKKKAWVGQMVSQVRQASAEKARPSDLKDMGKAGSTRRLFFRSKDKQ